jgi:hypothetical protein
MQVRDVTKKAKNAFGCKMVAKWPRQDVNPKIKVASLALVPASFRVDAYGLGTVFGPYVRRKCQR